MVHKEPLRPTCQHCEHPISNHLTSAAFNKPYHCDVCKTPLFSIQILQQRNGAIAFSQFEISRFAEFGKLLQARLGNAVYYEQEVNVDQLEAYPFEARKLLQSRSAETVANLITYWSQVFHFHNEIKVSTGNSKTQKEIFFT